MKRPSSQSLRNRPRSTSFGVLIITTFSAFLAFGQSTKTIYDAMREGKVTATFTATGGSSGDAIYLNITKTPAAGYGTLTITVPPGLRLQNLNGTWQSMVVSGVRGLWRGGNQYTPQPLIILNDAAPSATYLLSAYCAEFHKDNPSPASQFRVEPPDRTAACILLNASAQELSVAATQAAEWINTDRVTFNDLQTKFPLSSLDWKAAVEVASQCRPVELHFQATVPETPYSITAVGSLPDNESVSFRLEHIVPFAVHAGILEVSQSLLSWQETGPKAHPADNFEAACPAIVSAVVKPDTGILDIRLRGRKYLLDTARTGDETVSALRAISRICPQVPGPGN